MGQSLAKVSLVATMATLLQHFSFKLAEEVSVCYLTKIADIPAALNEPDHITLVSGICSCVRYSSRSLAKVMPSTTEHCVLPCYLCTVFFNSRVS